MRVISVNTNGIRAAARKGFFEWLPRQRADFICVQETKAQVDFLKSHGCRFMQGYLFSKPLTAPQLERVLRNQLERSKAEIVPPEIPRTGTVPG